MQVFVWHPSRSDIKNTAQKIKFSIKDFFSKYDQIRRKLRIWSHLLKEFLMENFIFCAMKSVIAVVVLTFVCVFHSRSGLPFLFAFWNEILSQLDCASHKNAELCSLYKSYYSFEQGSFHDTFSAWKQTQFR